MIRFHFPRLLLLLVCCATCACLPGMSLDDANAAPPRAAAPPAPAAPADPPPEATDSGERRLLELGPGDQISLKVFGQPDMDSTLSVGNDGSISVPLAGTVKVAGATPVVAAKRVEAALAKGQFLVDPHVTIALLAGRSQRVSVLGEVRLPGRYEIDPNTSIFDLLAQAGGTTADSSDIIQVSRTDANGKVTRYDIDLKALNSGTAPDSVRHLRSGDQVTVPRAEQFYIYGEVTNPNKYRIERGMTVVDAIARAGGITARGSERRVELKRLGKDGHYIVLHPKASDPVLPNDVIRVKESIF